METPSAKFAPVNKAVPIAIVHGLVGWALCGAAMYIGMAATTLDNALVLHAIAAPIIFAGITLAYFRRFGSWTPFRIAVAFLAVVIVMDVCVPALLIEHSFEMFRSPLGTWLPFLLLFLSSWLTGTLARRNLERSS